MKREDAKDRGVIWMESRPYEADEESSAGERPLCPQCDSIALRRLGRFGFWQRVILSRFGLFPWECGLCRKIYMLRQRSALGYNLAGSAHPSNMDHAGSGRHLDFALAHPIVEAMPREKVVR